MNLVRKFRFLLLAMALFFSTASVEAGSRKKKVEPSENKDKKGLYQVKVNHPGVECYTVYVPESYSEDNPAGIYVFIHGMGGSEWGKKMPGKENCDKFNLIGIAPSITAWKFTDGKAYADTILEALEQVGADYNIIPNRGMIWSFSAGGFAHEAFWKVSQGKRCKTYPFNSSYTASSSWQKSPVGGSGDITWVFSIGENEYGTRRRGIRMYNHSNARLAAAARGATPDILFNVAKGEGHHLTKFAKQAAADSFTRVDLAENAFLWEPAYSDPTIKRIAAKANKLQLGSALKDIERTLAGKPTDDQKEQAEKIKKKIETRIEEMFKITKKLAEEDPLLCGYYGPKYVAQLTGDPRQKELKKIISSITKQYAQAKKAYAVFIMQFAMFFPSEAASVSSKHVKTLEAIRDMAGEKSQLGKMATEYLQYCPKKSKEKSK